jgi:hypothetical protein
MEHRGSGQTSEEEGQFGWPTTLPAAHVMLSHTAPDEEFRAVRLALVAEALARSAEGTFGRLLRLHDHEGTLEAHWRARPGSFDARLVDFLWAEQAEYSVRHFLGQACILGTEHDGPVRRVEGDAPTPAHYPSGLTVLSREVARRARRDAPEGPL